MVEWGRTLPGAVFRLVLGVVASVWLSLEVAGVAGSALSPPPWLVGVFLAANVGGVLHAGYDLWHMPPGR